MRAPRGLGCPCLGDDVRQGQGRAESGGKGHGGQGNNAFDRAYAQCRTVVTHGREMRSVSDLLNGVRTDRARRVRPTIGEKLGVWQRRWQWPPRSYDTDARAASRSGGGSYGYVATKPALSDIHEFVLG